MGGKNVQRAGFSREGCCGQRGRVAVHLWLGGQRTPDGVAVHLLLSATMPDQATAKKLLQELIRNEALANKICNDCSNPNPQWASLRSVPFSRSHSAYMPLVSLFFSACNVPERIEVSACMSGTTIPDPASCS
jgi:hypothetical protein